jgi:hypothetical protein
MDEEEQVMFVVNYMVNVEESLVEWEYRSQV